MTEETLQREREALEKKSRMRRAAKKNRRRRGLRTFCTLLALAAVGTLCVCAAGLFRQEKTEGELSADPAAQVCVLSVGMEDGQYRTVTLSSGVTTTLEDYESEYVQFGLGEPVLLPSGVLDETGEDVAAMVGLPEGQEAEPTVAPTPTPTPALPEEDDEQPDGGAAAYAEAIASEAEGEGEYAAVSVDDVIVCTLQSREEFDWVMERVLRGCGTSEDAKIISRSTKEEVRVYLVSDVPEDTILTKEEGYLLLSDSLTLCWTEQQVKEEKLEPETIYLDDDSLEQGKTEIDEKGKDGRAKNTYAVSYEGGEEVSRTLKAQKILSESEPKIVLQGTKATPAPTKKSEPTPTPKKKDSAATPTPTPASGANGYWPGTNIGKGSDYPNIDTSLERPGPDQGIMGPDSGSLSFRYPTDKTHISSNFGWRYGRMHYGVDIFTDRNNPIYASEAGTVTSYTGTHTGYGLIVEIDHGNGFTTRYAHCEELLVKAGQKVKKGDVIARVGTSGTKESGPHCHFEIRNAGVPYNPRFYLKK